MTTTTTDTTDKTAKKEPSPQTIAKSQVLGMNIGELVRDLFSKTTIGLVFSALAWLSAHGFHVHVPFLATWLATAGGLVFLRHVARTAGKGWTHGQFESNLLKYTQAQKLAAAQTGASRLETLANALSELSGEQSKTGQYL